MKITEAILYIFKFWCRYVDNVISLVKKQIQNKVTQYPKDIKIKGKPGKV